MLVLIIHFFSLNFISIEIEGERVSSSQNERTLGGERGCSNKVGREGSKLGNLERTYFLNVPLVNYNPMTKNTH